MVNWVFDILGVIAFIGVAWATIRRRLVWLWRPSYLVTRIERHPVIGLRVTIIGRNGGPGGKYVSTISLLATSPKFLHQRLGWTSVKFFPENSDAETFIFPEGDSKCHAQLRVLQVYGDEWEDYPQILSKEKESKIVRELITWDIALEFKVETSEGPITLLGNSQRYPVAQEKISILRRLGRVF
jgi:hypothetical protein